MFQVFERFSREEEIVLQVLNYTNHPLFNISVGPVGGYDIATYVVNDEPLITTQLVPACLPTKAHKTDRGIFAGKID